MLHGAPIHKATPADEFAHTTSCAECKELVHKVPGGSGPVWVHVATGMVAGKDPVAHDD